MKIPFNDNYRKKYFKILNQIFDSNMWTEGRILKEFEEKFGEYVGLGARTISNGGSGLLAIYEYIGVRGKEVIVPANTFWATAQAAKLAGANVIYADCNKNDLCVSYDDIVKKITPNTKAIVVVHIGGHFAFEIEKISEYCKQKNIYLVEDCAHCHGAWWNGKTGGHWGFAGSYSFYATKTMPTGDGGMVVSRDKDFLKWLEKYRNYGKEVIGGKVAYPLKNGFNYRMPEFTCALGLAQLEQLPEILEWKNKLAEKYDKIFERRIKFPEGMKSGYYKYIVFDYNLKEQTGQVFGPNDLGYRIEELDFTLENSEWITKHHQCAPIWYGWEKADKNAEELKKILI
ncbi:MAG TPA: aminotransferase class I/II-fold pyridoxal phosphate-dependent enzyme [bacterium]|nr:aminotransferase class I/II-fold pyridoxal phosphate-dependent enzyme [bacterium]